MSTRTCVIPGCERLTRGGNEVVCEPHRHRYRRRGAYEPRLGTSYKSVHRRPREQRGPASAHPCSRDCGRQASDWAFDWLSNPEHPRFDPTVGCVYTTDLNAYVPMCDHCHQRSDRRIRETLKQATILAQQNKRATA